MWISLGGDSFFLSLECVALLCVVMGIPVISLSFDGGYLFLHIFNTQMRRRVLIF